MPDPSDPVHRLIGALNAAERPPIPLETLAQASGLPLADLVQGSAIHTRLGEVSLSMSGRLERAPGADTEVLLVDTVHIHTTGSGLTLPPVPKGATRFDRTTYAYLPTIEHIERAGDRYRGLKYVDRPCDGQSNITEWAYRIDTRRGPFVSEAEVQGRREVILGLLQAIREDRFEERYVSFVEAFPEDHLGSHAVHGASITIRYFDDRIEGRKEAFLAKDKLISYVGIHVYCEQHGEDRYPQPWLFDFFGIESLDATRFYRGAPYNPVDNDIPGRTHPQADLEDPLPDISAAGHRDGGLAYYANLEWRDGSFTFECPGLYPHDGKTVPRILDPALLQFGGFVVTHSRRRR